MPPERQIPFRGYPLELKLNLVAGIPEGEDAVYILNADSHGNLKTRNLIWNPSSLAWEAATGSLAGGGNVTVNNFPADQLVHDADVHDDLLELIGLTANGPDNTLRMDDVSPDISYIGEADPGSMEADPVWKIKKMVWSPIFKKLFADGDKDFDNVWTDRINLYYS